MRPIPELVFNNMDFLVLILCSGFLYYQKNLGKWYLSVLFFPNLL